jgi:hypothetical protein
MKRQKTMPVFPISFVEKVDEYKERFPKYNYRDLVSIEQISFLEKENTTIYDKAKDIIENSFSKLPDDIEKFKNHIYFFDALIYELIEYYNSWNRSLFNDLRNSVAIEIKELGFRDEQMISELKRLKDEFNSGWFAEREYIDWRKKVNIKFSLRLKPITGCPKRILELEILDFLAKQMKALSEKNMDIVYFYIVILEYRLRQLKEIEEKEKQRELRRYYKKMEKDNEAKNRYSDF